MIKTRFTDLGVISYEEAWEYQEKYFAKALKAKKEGEVENLLIFCEHPHVYTLGKSGDEQNLLLNHIQLMAKEASFHKVNRGGDITYHGPGQLVGYPIIDLEQFGLGVKDYIRELEASVIRLLKDYDIQGERLEGATGVWLDVGKPTARKICAIGVKVSRWITMHGFALNVNTDLKYFDYINPCGFIDKGVTSIAKEKGKIIDEEELKERLKLYLAETFKMEL